MSLALASESRVGSSGWSWFWVRAATTATAAKRPHASAAPATMQGSFHFDCTASG